MIMRNILRIHLIFMIIFIVIMIIQHEISLNKDKYHDIDEKKRNFMKNEIFSYFHDNLSEISDNINRNEMNMTDHYMNNHLNGNNKDISQNQSWNHDNTSSQGSLSNITNKLSNNMKIESYPGKLTCQGREIYSEVIYWKQIPHDMDYFSPWRSDQNQSWKSMNSTNNINENDENDENDDNTTSYITFEYDLGGWNNIRMGIEIILVFAHITGKTLVLPPSKQLYLLDKSSKRLNLLNNTSNRLNLTEESSKQWVSRVIDDKKLVSDNISHYHDFSSSNIENYYDLSSMKRSNRIRNGLSIITMNEFIPHLSHDLKPHFSRHLTRQSLVNITNQSFQTQNITQEALKIFNKYNLHVSTQLNEVKDYNMNEVMNLQENEFWKYVKERADVDIRWYCRFLAFSANIHDYQFKFLNKGMNDVITT